MNTRQLIQLFTVFVLTLSASGAYSADKTSSHKSASNKASAEHISSEGFSYQIEPVPGFVRKAPEDSGQPKNVTDFGDVLMVLLDRQVSLLGQKPEEYVHVKKKPLTAASISQVSQISISFNPVYQTMVLNGIRVWRDGKATDLTKTVKLDLLRREVNLENNMYEGNVTAVGILPDVAVNDVIEYEYTVKGSNPIFAGKYSDFFSMTQESYVDQYRFSLITPHSRPIKIDAPAGINVQEERAQGDIRYLVEKRAIKKLQIEDHLPTWYLPYQYIQVSEYKDWNEVGDWANGLFQVNGELSPEIRKQLDTWRGMNLPKDQLAVLVLQWVQSQIRYFGIEIGTNSHLPSPPNITVERKYGDCKDKSLLLATLLKNLDIDATPTLASLYLTRNTVNLIPSPAVFDHAIVRVVIDGKTYWFDATKSTQFGKLDKLAVFDYGWVFPLGDGASQLAATGYPAGYENHLQKDTHIILNTLSEPAKATVQIKVNYEMAENLRSYHDHQSKEEFNKYFQGTILRYYPKAVFSGDVEFADDQANNEVVLTNRFVVNDFLKYDPDKLSTEFIASEILSWDSFPEKTQRTEPFALPLHSLITESIEVEFPVNPDFKPNKTSTNNPGNFWTFTTQTNNEKERIQQVWTLKANMEAVQPQKIGDYISESTDIRKRLGVNFHLPVQKLSSGDVQKIDSALQKFNYKYGKTASDRVKVEKDDAVNLVLVSSDINSGKLAGKQLAVAYKTRAQAYDDRGDVPHALADIRAAQQLEPDNVDHVVFEAETLLGDGQFESAAQAYEKAMNMNNASGASNSGLYKGYGQALHYLGKDDKAVKQLDASLADGNGIDTMYAAIWRHIASAQAPDSLQVLQQNLDGAQDHSWPYPVEQMYLGKITTDQLIEAASSQDRGLKEDQLCEAYFYIGQKYLLAGDKEKADEYFQKSIDQGVLPFIENGFSLHELGKKRAPKTDGLFGLF